MSSVEPLDSVLPAGSGVEAVRKLREVTDVAPVSDLSQIAQTWKDDCSPVDSQDGSDSWNSYFQNHGLDTVLTETQINSV